MKTFLKLTLITCILMFTLGQTANAQFSDLSEDNPHYQTVMNLVGAGVVDGYENGTIGLENEITRAELIKIIVTGKGLNPNTLEYNRCFNDVVILDWYVRYICYAEAQGWVLGYPDGTFRPGESINNAEVLSMIFRSYDFITPMLDDFDNWYDPYVWFGQAYDILTQDEFDKPYNAALRSDAFEILDKTLALYNSDGEVKIVYSEGNLSISYTNDFKLEIDEAMPEAFAFINENDEGVGFLPLSFFEEFIKEMTGMTGEEIDISDFFEELDMPGVRVPLTVKKGRVLDVLENNEFKEGEEGLFVLVVEPESGKGEGYYIFGFYSDETTRSAIIEMINSIEVE